MKKNVNNNVYSLIKKCIICFMLVCLFITSLCSFDSFAASRYKYSFEMQNGDLYTIITENGEDGLKIISTYSEIRSKKNSAYLTGNSLYDLVASEYEKFESPGKEEWATEILKLLQLFVSNRKNSSGADANAQISFDGKVIVSGHKGSVSYDNGYDEIIKKASNEKKNPYSYKEGIRNRKEILYNSKRLDDIYTDLELIKAYEACTNNSLKYWITKEETTDVFNLKGDYKLHLDSVTEPYKLVLTVTDEENNIVGSFLIGEKKEDDYRYKELIQENEGVIKWFVEDGKEGIGIDSKLEKQKYKVDTKSSTYNEKKYDFADNIKFYYSKKIFNYEEENEENINNDEYKPQNLEQKFYDKTKNIINLPNNIGFVAIRNNETRNVNVYLLEYQKNKAGEINKRECNAKLIGSIPANILDEYTTDGDIKTSTQGWILAKEDTTLKIYKEENEGVDEETYYLSLSQLHNCYVKPNDYYDIMIPIKKGIASQYQHQITGEVNQLIAVVQSSKKVPKFYENGMVPLNSFFEDIRRSDVEMKLMVYETKKQLKEEQLGKNEVDCLPVQKGTYFDNYENNSLLPPPLSIKAFFSTKDIEEKYGDYENENSLLDDVSGISIAFIGELIGYGKMILAFLIFVGIVIAGLQYSFNGSINAEERTKVILKFRHLIFGVIVLLVMIPAIIIAIDYMDQGFGVLSGLDAQVEEMIYDFEEKDEDGLILEMLTVLIKLTNDIMNGLIQIFSKVLAGDSDGVDYIKIIYDCYDQDGKVSALKPFINEVEWTRCISGYAMLARIAFFMLLVSIVLTSIQYIVSAGDERKITQIKDTWYRIFWAILLIVCIPYIVQALIYLMNYLTAIIPVNTSDSRFNLEVILTRQDTFISALARNIFLTTKCNIYMTFLVRKIMLSVLLVSGPIVIASWAINEKVRSLHVWMGELITNIATQFCYAIGFLIVVLLSYDSNNAIYGIILISLSITFSKFIKDSLQGYFQGWGGIDEESVGSNVVARAFGWVKKGINAVKSIGASLNSLGGKLEKAGTSPVPGDKIDIKNELSGKDEGVTRSFGAKVGRIMQNSGAIMQLDADKLRLENKREKALKSKLALNERIEQQAKQKFEESLEDEGANKEEILDAFNIADNMSKVTNNRDFDEKLEEIYGLSNEGKEYIKAKRETSKTRDELKKYVQDPFTYLGNQIRKKIDKKHYGVSLGNNEINDLISIMPDDGSNKEKSLRNKVNDVENGIDFSSDSYESEMKAFQSFNKEETQNSQTSQEHLQEDAKAYYNNAEDYLKLVEDAEDKMKILDIVRENMILAAKSDANSLYFDQEEVLIGLCKKYAEKMSKELDSSEMKIDKEVIENQIKDELERTYKSVLKGKNIEL